MGHSSIQVTVDLYGHLIPGGNKRAVDRLDSMANNALAERENAPQAHPPYAEAPQQEAQVPETTVKVRSGSGVSDVFRICTESYPVTTG